MSAHVLSVIKAVLWRTLGTLATLGIAFFVTGEFYISAGIAVTEFVAKVVLFYLHERAWVNLAQRFNVRLDEHTTTAYKTVSWRATGTLATMAISFGFTGNPLAAVKIGLGEIIFKLVLYYGYERVWVKIAQWMEQRKT